MQAVFLTEVKKSLQDKGLFFWMFILPILFIVLFNAVFTNGNDQVANQQVTASIVPGYAVMFSFFIMISMVTVFVKDRERGMVARLASTPLSPYFYLLGKWLPHLLIVLIQISVLFLFGLLAYFIPFAQPLTILILSLFLSFTTTGLGLALAVLVKTENMGIAITQLVGLGGAMVGGLWIPLEFMPNFMQTISRVLPQYWTHQAFQDAMTGSATLVDIAPALLILTGYGLVGFLLALVNFPRFLKSGRS